MSFYLQRGHASKNPYKILSKKDVKEDAPSTSCNNLSSIPTAKTALHLYHQVQSQPSRFPLLSTNQPLSWLELIPGGLYELAGQAGVGKTQIAVSLCVSLASSPSCPRAALYISLKGPGSTVKVTQRLQSMTRARCHSHQVDDVLSRIWLKSIVNADDLVELLLSKELESKLESTTSVGVVVLDCIADVFRSVQESHASRASTLFAMAARLKQLSELYEVPVLVLNQVTAQMDSSYNCNGKVVAALGLSWAHCVSTRYFVTRPLATSSRRTIFLEQSPTHHCPQQCHFCIRAEGVMECNESGNIQEITNVILT